MVKIILAAVLASSVGMFTVTNISDKAVEMSNGGHLYKTQITGTPHIGDKLTVVYLPNQVNGFITN